MFEFGLYLVGIVVLFKDGYYEKFSHFESILSFIFQLYVCSYNIVLKNTQQIIPALYVNFYPRDTTLYLVYNEKPTTVLLVF